MKSEQYKCLSAVSLLALAATLPSAECLVVPNPTSRLNKALIAARSRHRLLTGINDEQPTGDIPVSVETIVTPVGSSLLAEPNDDSITTGTEPIAAPSPSENILPDLSSQPNGIFVEDEMMLGELGNEKEKENGDTLSPADPAEEFLSAPGEVFTGDEAKMIVENVLETSSPNQLMEEIEIRNNLQNDVGVIMAASLEAVEQADSSFSRAKTDDIHSEVLAVAEPETMPKVLPALDAIEEALAPNKIDTPSVTKIFTFAISAIGVFLCSPLLSLIDTGAVGLLSGTAQQAALNPAVAVTDYAALIMAFMYTATTNLVAEAQEADSGVEGKPRTLASFKAALQMSGYVGLALGAFLFVFARQLLRSIIGNDAISPEVFQAGMKYVRIRALGMPAAAIIGSAQAACVGMQDLRSPLYVLLAAALINLVGDVIFVGSSHPFIGGAAGAAWASVFSQYAAVAFFVRWLCEKPAAAGKRRVVNLTNAIMELTGGKRSEGEGRGNDFRAAFRSIGEASKKKPFVQHIGKLTKHFSKKKTSKQTKDKKAKDESFSTRGFMHGKFSGWDLLKFPEKKHAKEFAPYVIPVTSTQVGRVSSYVAMSHVVSSSLGTVSMAAQQVIVSLFYCLCPVADSLSLTAQSFVPTISGKKVSKERSRALRNTTSNFLKAGGIFGALMTGAISCIPLLSRFFTSDPVVVNLVNMVVPLLMGCFAVHATICATEGLLLAQKDLGFLGKTYAFFFAAVPYFMLRVKKAALAGKAGVNLASVWRVFLGYQLFRSVAWVGRVMQLQKRTHKEANEMGALAV